MDHLCREKVSIRDAEAAKRVLTQFPDLPRGFGPTTHAAGTKFTTRTRTHTGTGTRYRGFYPTRDDH